MTFFSDIKCIISFAVARDDKVQVFGHTLLNNCQIPASEVVLMQSGVFVFTLNNSVGLGFTQTVALKPKSRLTAHHRDCRSSRITLAHLSVTHTYTLYMGLQAACLLEDCLDRWSVAGYFSLNGA